MAESPLGIERREAADGAALEIWTLRRPAAANALSRALVDALDAALNRALADPGVRALIIAGAGGKAFCAGADLKERRGMSEAEVHRFLDQLGRVLWRLDRAPWPVIAAIDGVALGGGLELALACDLRIAGPGAVLGLPETSLAIIPGAGGTQRLTHLVGPALAKRLVLLAERVDAPRAQRLGLVDELAPESALALAEDWGARLARGAPVALAAALEAIDAATDSPLAEGLAVERSCYARTLATQDRCEALEAFAAKRPPVFRGR